MNWTSAAERVTSILRWLWYFVYIQFLFVVGTLACAVVGGVFPSFYASILTAQYLMGRDGGYFATRWYISAYKAVFWKSQQLGYLSTLVFLVCMSNIVFFNQLQATASWAYFVKIAWFIATVVVMSVLSLVSASFVNYRVSLRRLPGLMLAGLRDLRSIVLIVTAVVVLGAGVLYFTGFFLYVGLGAFILLLAAVNASFERRMVTFGRGGDTATAERGDAVADETHAAAQDVPASRVSPRGRGVTGVSS